MYDTVRIIDNTFFYKSLEVDHMTPIVTFNCPIKNWDDHYFIINSESPISLFKKQLNIIEETLLSEIAKDSIRLRFLNKYIDYVEFDIIIDNDTIRQTLQKEDDYIDLIIHPQAKIQIGNIHTIYRSYWNDILPYYVAFSDIRNIPDFTTLEIKDCNFVKVGIGNALQKTIKYHAQNEIILYDKKGKWIKWKNRLYHRVKRAKPLILYPYIYDLHHSS